MRKKDEHRHTIRYKARLVAQGFSQKPGTNYFNTSTFTPIMQFKSLHTMIALAAVNDWEVQMLDIKTAYLNEYLEKEIFIV